MVIFGHSYRAPDATAILEDPKPRIPRISRIEFRYLTIRVIRVIRGRSLSRKQLRVTLFVNIRLHR
jgi:hypothetical protein